YQPVGMLCHYARLSPALSRMGGRLEDDELEEARAMPEDYQIIDLTLTLPRNPNSPYTPRDMASIHWIVVQHSAGPADQTPESVARFHVETRGWSGIGYNYLVYEDGRIFAGRPLDVLPACVKGHNEESLCICFVGDFS